MNAWVPSIGGSAALLLACGAALPLDAGAAGRHAGAAAQPPVPVHAGHRHGAPHPQRGHGHGYGHGYGYGWGGVALGIGLGALLLSRPWGPRVIDPPQPVPVEPALPPTHPHADGMPVPPREPVIHPSHGQGAGHLEADRQACNRWATTQPAALADAGDFHRTTLACLESRGYTVR